MRVSLRGRGVTPEVLKKASEIKGETATRRYQRSETPAPHQYVIQEIPMIVDEAITATLTSLPTNAASLRSAIIPVLPQVEAKSGPPLSPNMAQSQDGGADAITPTHPSVTSGSEKTSGNAKLDIGQEHPQRTSLRRPVPDAGAAAKRYQKKMARLSANLPPVGTRSPRIKQQELSDEELGFLKTIDDLWSEHKEKAATVRGGRAELNGLKMRLGEQFSQYKKLLVGTGRDGQWSRFLRGRGIAKSTADRYVQRWDAAQLPQPEKLLTEERPLPSREDILAFVKKLKPQLMRKLRTPDAASIFLAEIAIVVRALPADK
ncbi:hypothetical protein [Granulicella aggregans]|uniref:hypothetical protein n=1 Tax=Granulicella aggregans TaxID=474949 RepID=UPI0021E0A633|nr:hypothetical protein [Granulicella aggregans]